MAKRVCCLYRVSTLKQVEKDDIPMQKQRCHEFAAQMGWDIVREFSEKGVSGFKVSAKQRDAIQEIQREAALNTFDILLVFMFDRLGRRDDETPFIVEWFVNNGIEVWSAEEGQQRFDNHVDKLLNYIRYWQASGESIKTSIRTKTRLGQIVMEGRFRGGYAPYGYQLVKKGRMGKKNRELFDIEVNPMEAAAVRRIFELADQYGYGGRKTSTTLKEEGFINLRTSEPFHYSTIQNILINIAYTGVLRSGESVSEIFPELQIITPEQFQRVQKGREQRSADYLAKCAAAYGTETITLKDGSEAEVSRPIRSYPRKIPAVLCCPAMCIAVTAVAAFLRLRQEKRITRQTAVPVAWRSTSAITAPSTKETATAPRPTVPKRWMPWSARLSGIFFRRLALLASTISSAIRSAQRHLICSSRFGKPSWSFPKSISSRGAGKD